MPLFTQKNDDYESALSVYLSLDSLKKRNANNAFMVGVCMLKTSRQLKAGKYFDKAEKEGCKDPKLTFYLGSGAPS